MLELPELPLCPRHKETPPKSIASCHICWTRFYLKYEYDPILARLNRRVKEYTQDVERLCAAN